MAAVAGTFRFDPDVIWNMDPRELRFWLKQATWWNTGKEA